MKDSCCSSEERQWTRLRTTMAVLRVERFQSEECRGFLALAFYCAPSPLSSFEYLLHFKTSEVFFFNDIQC